MFENPMAKIPSSHEPRIHRIVPCEYFEEPFPLPLWRTPADAEKWWLADHRVYFTYRKDHFDPRFKDDDDVRMYSYHRDHWWKKGVLRGRVLRMFRACR